MPVNDEQLEQLEAYMDGELPSDQEGVLLHRLASEPELAAAMTALRASRDARVAVWRACEPDDAAVQRLITKVERAVDRDVAWANRFARWRIPSAAAACILVGFLVGWIGRGGAPFDPTATPGGAALVADSSPRQIQPVPIPRNVPNANPNPGLTVVGTRVNSAPRQPGPVELPIVNEYGQQVGVQRFATEQDAARFLEDLQRWQQTQQKVINGNVTPVGAHQF